MQIKDFSRSCYTLKNAEIMFSPILEKHIFYILDSKSENQLFDDHFSKKRLFSQTNDFSCSFVKKSKCWNHVFSDLRKTDFGDCKFFQVRKSTFWWSLMLLASQWFFLFSWLKIKVLKSCFLRFSKKTFFGLCIFPTPKMKYFFFSSIIKKFLFANQWFFSFLCQKISAEIMYSPIFEKQIFEVEKIFSQKINFLMIILHNNSFYSQINDFSCSYVKKSNCWNHVFSDFLKTKFLGQKFSKSENQLFDDHFSE